MIRDSNAEMTLFLSPRPRRLTRHRPQDLKPVCVSDSGFFYWHGYKTGPAPITGAGPLTNSSLLLIKSAGNRRF